MVRSKSEEDSGATRSNVGNGARDAGRVLPRLAMDRNFVMRIEKGKGKDFTTGISKAACNHLFMDKVDCGR